MQQIFTLLLWCYKLKTKLIKWSGKCSYFILLHIVMCMHVYILTCSHVNIHIQHLHLHTYILYKCLHICIQKYIISKEHKTHTAINVYSLHHYCGDCPNLLFFSNTGPELKATTKLRYCGTQRQLAREWSPVCQKKILKSDNYENKWDKLNTLITN